MKLEEKKEKKRKYWKKYYKKNRKFLLNKCKKYDRLHRKEKRNYKLKKIYGLDIIKYNELLMKQGGVCAICFKEETCIDSRTKLKINLPASRCCVVPKSEVEL